MVSRKIAHRSDLSGLCLAELIQGHSRIAHEPQQLDRHVERRLVVLAENLPLLLDILVGFFLGLLVLLLDFSRTLLLSLQFEQRQARKSESNRS